MVISPGFPAETGVANPTVYRLDTLASPCRYREIVSTPSSESEVILLLKITGESNLEIILLFSPPSTVIERLTLTSTGLMILYPTLRGALYLRTESQKKSYIQNKLSHKVKMLIRTRNLIKNKPKNSN